jgi:hypothetical protein
MIRRTSLKGGDAMRRNVASHAHAYRREGQKREEPFLASCKDSENGSW